MLVEHFSGLVRLIVIPGKHTAAAHQDLAIVGQAKFQAVDEAANPPHLQVGGGWPRRYCRSLGHTPTFMEGESERLPEVLHLRSEGRCPRYPVPASFEAQFTPRPFSDGPSGQILGGLLMEPDRAAGVPSPQSGDGGVDEAEI